MKPLSAVAAALLALSGPVSAAGRDRVASKAAQNVAIARLAPDVCDGLVTDPDAIGQFMASVGIGERDLTTRYADVVGEALRGFREAVDTDEDLACSRLDQRLGQAGLGLIRESGADGDGE